MKLGIISGSHRENSESERVAHYYEKEVKAAGASVYLFSLAKNPLPLWDEGVWGDDPKWKSVWGPISQELQSCDGFVIVSPEWSGMVPAALKNFFLLTSPRDVGHKAALIVAVSSGLGGSYPVAELRQSSYKNTRICYMPEHVIIRTVGEMLKGETPANDHDASLRKRITYTTKLLMEYSKALGAVRESGVLNYKEYPYGM